MATTHTISRNGDGPKRFGRKNADIHIQLEIDEMRIESLSVDDYIRWSDAVNVLQGFDVETANWFQMPISEAVEFMAVFLVDKDDQPIPLEKAKKKIRACSLKEILEMFNIFSLEFAAIQERAVNPPKGD